MATLTASGKIPDAGRPSLSKLRRREEIAGYLWISPWLIGFAIFHLGPVIASLYLSTTRYNILKAPLFLGLQNYIQALTGDALFWSSLGRTVYFTVGSLGLGLIGSLLAALALNQRLKATSLYRTLFYLPSLTPVVAVASIWVFILSRDVGLMDNALDLINVQGPRWFADPRWAMPAVILITFWASVGGPRMIIYLAGLQGVPQEMYDAASIDGANVWQRFLHVTIPMMTPTIFFNLVLGIIGSFTAFELIYAATAADSLGGPRYATHLYSVYVYRKAFQSYDLGYASALSWLLFLVLLTFTYIQFRSASRWVHYEGEVR